MEDTLMRIFASERVRNMMQKLGMEEGEAIEHPWVSKAIENAQRKVESHNFDIRKHLLEYDDVANDQRKVVYEQRNELMEADDISEDIDAITFDVVEGIISAYIAPQSMPEQWDPKGLSVALDKELGLKADIDQWLDRDDKLHEESLRERIHKEVNDVIAAKGVLIGEDVMKNLKKDIMMQILDGKWKEHLAAMDYLRQSIGLRGYAQKNPKQEYKREAFDMFQQLLEQIKSDTVGLLCKIQFEAEKKPEFEPVFKPEQDAIEMRHDTANSILNPQPEIRAEKPASKKARKPTAGTAPMRVPDKIGRNDPCPCGSGKKFKQCHGKLA
jgi:preprotein translocase subunit SecA